MENLPDHCNLGILSQHFNLNLEQHIVFCEAGARLIKCWCNTDPDLTNQQQQKVSLFTGLPGTGKSRVILALQKLAQLWNQPSSVLTCAYTHAASNNVKGVTLHSAFGIPIVLQNTASPNQTICTYRKKTRLLIIDETSQISPDLLGAVSNQLKFIFDNTSAFGGIDCILSLDWIQVFKKI
jgi:hypothetical protein